MNNKKTIFIRGKLVLPTKKHQIMQNGLNGLTGRYKQLEWIRVGNHEVDRSISPADTRLLRENKRYDLVNLE